ncbi:flavin-containing monooxygenase [Streptomyces sp. NPDC005122]
MNAIERPERHDVVVIGAGSAGLAAAMCIQREGLEVIVLESASEVGDAWRRRYTNLRLNSIRNLSGLPFMRIPRSYGTWLSGNSYADYLAEYAQHFGLNVRTGSRALSIDPVSDGAWRVSVGSEYLEASVVVVATGFNAIPVWPEWPGREAFVHPMIHSSEYRSPGSYEGLDVVVIGANNSATEIAADLVGTARRVRVSVRGGPLLVPTRLAGISLQRLAVLGAHVPEPIWNPFSRALHWGHYRDLQKYAIPVPSQGAFERFRLHGGHPAVERGFARHLRSGGIETVAAVSAFEADSVILADGSAIQPDAVIAATGYRPQFAELVGHLGVLTDSGLPRSWAAPLASAPGLYIVGSEALTGTLRQHGNEARQVARTLRALPA